LERSAEDQMLYFRFNVDRDVGDIGLEEWKQICALTTHTAAYMLQAELEKKRNMCAKCLIDSSEFTSK